MVVYSFQMLFEEHCRRILKVSTCQPHDTINKTVFWPKAKDFCRVQWDSHINGVNYCAEKWNWTIHSLGACLSVRNIISSLMHHCLLPTTRQLQQKQKLCVGPWLSLIQRSYLVFLFGNTFSTSSPTEGIICYTTGCKVLSLRITQLFIFNMSWGYSTVRAATSVETLICKQVDGNRIILTLENHITVFIPLTIVAFINITKRYSFFFIDFFFCFVSVGN